MRGVPGLAALLCLGAFGCTPNPGPTSTQQRTDSVIYGEDDRRDVYAHPDPAWQDRARRSIVALISAQRVRVGADAVEIIDNGTLQSRLGVCPDEPFAQQPVTADCSGTLVGDDLVITAGHCINANSCGRIRFVFDYHLVAEGQLETVEPDDVYRCAEVMAWALDETDIALVRLDRPVVGPREAVEVRWDVARLPVDAPLVMIGFPSGLPAKIEDGGRVVDPGRANVTRFSATVDAYGGNSGSGVFSREDGRMVGVLVAGAQDYVRRGGCLVSNRLPDAVPQAESVVYVSRARTLLCDDTPDHPLCGERDLWCQPCDGDGDCDAPGWRCRREGVCAPACADGGACRADHVCQGGACRPEVTAYCRDGDVWVRDTCGVVDARSDVCGPAAECVEGECVALELDASVPDAAVIDAFVPDLAVEPDLAVPDAFAFDAGGWGNDAAPPWRPDAGAPPDRPEAAPRPGPARDWGPAGANTEIPWAARSRPSCQGAGGALPPWPFALALILLRPRRRRR